MLVRDLPAEFGNNAVSMVIQTKSIDFSFPVEFPIDFGIFQN